MPGYRLQRISLFAGLLLLLFAGGCGLWLQAQQRQHALDRQLIAALVHDDNRKALALIESGADPNTRYLSPPPPTLRDLWNQLLHHASPPTNDSPTAFLIANGANWNEDPAVNWQPALDRTEDVPLLQAMLVHSANIHAMDRHHRTALHMSIYLRHANMVHVLLEQGVDVNAQDEHGQTALCLGIYYDASEHMISQLLAHHANPNLAADDGANALYLAQRQDNPDIIALLRHYDATPKKPDPPTSVPAIAQLLGVKVGYNGQDALIRPFGDGLHTIGGHPNGFIHWFTQNPAGKIDTDGFNYNEEGLVLESLSWELVPAIDGSMPVARKLPHNAGWLGVIYPGMTMQQVSQLTAGKVPAPQQQGNIWTWTAKGFVRPYPDNYDVYTTWTAQLTFQNGILNVIDVECDGGLSAP